MTAPRAIVVGAGPAGASAALGLLRAGLDVEVYEQRTTWQERVCGGVVNPEGVGHLAWLGVLDEAVTGGGVWVRASVVTTPAGRSGRIEVERRGTTALGITRKTLEAVLLQAVDRRGGGVHLGRRVLHVTRRGSGFAVTSRVAGGDTRVDEVSLVVLADGRFSAAARLATPKAREGWFGWNATFDGARQDAGTLSMHFHDRGYVGALTFADGSTNVCGLSWIDETSPRGWEEVFDDARQRQPALATLVARACRMSEWRGVGPLPFCRSMRTSDGPLLAGDAAAVGDPYMGEGISRALGTGPLIAAAFARIGSFDGGAVAGRYDRLWRRRYTPRLILGTATRALQRHPRAFQAALHGLVAHPALATLLLRVCHPAGAVRGAGAAAR